MITPLIGVDFDNTIVCYDGLFHRVAVEQRLIPAHTPTTKEAVRDYLRQHRQEDLWTELQGHVYGARMSEAAPFPGVRDFFARCVREGRTVHIISHKTRHPYRGPQYDLHEVAYHWLIAQGFFDSARIGLSPECVHFDLTKQEKLARIAQVGCTHFVDDLPEFLAEPTFPAGVSKILFSPSGAPSASVHTATTWAEIEALLLGEKAVAHAG